MASIVRGEGREQTLAATIAALRQRIAAVALEVARVEDELAGALDRRAETVVSRVDELPGRATLRRVNTRGSPPPES